jgi:hypothetical protein
LQDLLRGERSASIRYRRSTAGVSSRAMSDRFVPSDKAKEVADALKSVLDALVELYDAETETYHLSMTTWWFSHRDHYDDRLPGGSRMSARINERWMLHVSRQPFLHPDARSLVKWTARKLETCLPRYTVANPMYPPFGRS